MGRAAGRWALPVLVGLVGAWLAMAVFGARHATLGPFRVKLDAGFGRSVTDVALPPFGLLSADTHAAPMRFTATLEDVQVPQLSAAIAREGTAGLAADVEQDALDRIVPFLLRVLAVAVGGAVILALAVFRARWRPVAIASLAALLAVGGCELVAWRTFHIDAFDRPTYEGSLALAPKLIGPVREAGNTIEDFRAELEQIVDGAARAYTSIQQGTVGGQDVITVLHVSDIHLSPLGQDFTREIAQGFGADLVIDTGDLTSFGTRPESFVLSQIRSLQVPYVFVRGNHDSFELQRELAQLPNGIVLDGTQRTVDGLSIYGLGHPVFTPNKEAPVDDRAFAEAAREAGERVLADVESLSAPPDIVAVHDDRMAESVAGLVPLVVSGHFHEESAHVQRGTLYLRDGSTGGSGFEVFTQPGGVPLSAEVLYFAKSPTPHLIAFDVIQQKPESGSLTVQRHVVREEFGDLQPSPPAETRSPEAGRQSTAPSRSEMSRALLTA